MWIVTSCYPCLPTAVSTSQRLPLTKRDQCVCGGDAYSLTKEHFQLKKSTFASKLGDNVDCHQLLPILTKSGKLLTTLTAYQTSQECLCVGGGRRLLAYQRAFSIEKSTSASKLGDNVDCYQLLPMLTKSGKLLTTLTAYHTGTEYVCVCGGALTRLLKSIFN